MRRPARRASSPRRCRRSPTAPSTTDPRVGLKAGLTDAGSAINGLRLVSHVSKPPLLDGEGGARGLTFANSDLAFRGNFVFQGNFSGFQIWDISNPASPSSEKAVRLRHRPGRSVDLRQPALPLLGEHGQPHRLRHRGRRRIAVSTDRMVGVRIYDISDIGNPRKVADVQTCRGSHTHTLVPDPNDPGVVYVYVSGLGGVRSGEELAGCVEAPIDSPEHVALPRRGDQGAARASGAGEGRELRAHLQRSRRAARARRRAERRWRAGARAAAMPAGGPRSAARRPEPVPRHHRLSRAGWLAAHAAATACCSTSRIPRNPKRLQAVGDTNFAFWHSATFNNDGTKVLFTDEWGGGTQPKCRADDPIDWGGDAIFTLRAST